MKPIRFFIDTNYPKKLVQALDEIHQLQKQVRYEVVRWDGQVIKSAELKSSVFLLVDFHKRGLDIPTVKHYEDGYRVVACKAGEEPKLDYFEFAMTVLRVWPYIVDAATNDHQPFLYTFRYGGERLAKYRKAEP